MWDWATWQTVEQTAWDWGSKIGLGGVVVWLIQRWFSKRDKAAERGRALVDGARPELVPMTNLGSQYVVALAVENQGKGVARTLRVGFTGVREIETRDDVPVSQMRQVATLNVRDSPFFTEAHDGRADITLAYADRYDNEYRLTIPVTRRRRDDGGFNMDVHMPEHQNIEPKLSKTRLRKIGGS
jgi:hypothetical protein